MPESTFQTIPFHEHLDVCEQCANNPFGLCEVGAKLLPQAANAHCPFCGSNHVYHRLTPLGQAIACRNCQAIGPCCKVRGDNAIALTWELWNTRHPVIR